MTIESLKVDGLFPAVVWPGGYPMVYFTRDGLTICARCANREVGASQEVIAGDIYWEGPKVQCDDCGGLLESAYGDPNAPD